MRAKTSSLAFTAVELIVFLTLATLVIFGACMIFLGTLQSVNKIGEQSDNVRESARIQRRLLAQAGEAMFVQLPEDKLQKNSWPSSAIGSASKYRTSRKGVKTNAGLLAYLPASYNLVLRNAAGGEISLAGDAAPLKRTTTGKATLIYRGDKSGKPAPENGECLWLRSQTSGTTFADPVLVSQNLSTQQGAVLLERDDDKIDVVRASLMLKEAALAGNETNPIEFTIRVSNYSSGAETLVQNVVSKD
jgi:hypothetical protein